MYSWPSTSQTRAPLARSTKNGCPPTARKARTGEFTPPGIYLSASAKSCSDLDCEITVAAYSASTTKPTVFSFVDRRIQSGNWNRRKLRENGEGKILASVSSCEFF